MDCSCTKMFIFVKSVDFEKGWESMINGMVPIKKYKSSPSKF